MSPLFVDRSLIIRETINDLLFAVGQKWPKMRSEVIGILYPGLSIATAGETLRQQIEQMIAEVEEEARKRAEQDRKKIEDYRETISSLEQNRTKNNELEKQMEKLKRDYGERDQYLCERVRTLTEDMNAQKALIARQHQRLQSLLGGGND